MENEMLAFPFVVLVVVGTAILSSIITASLPSLPKWFNAFKNAITRVFTRKRSNVDMVDVIIIAQLQERIDELEEQVNNVAANSYTREKNRKSNIRREVRDYLAELRK